METARLSTKGRLVIPNELRKAHHLAAGTEFVVSFVGDEIRLTPVPMFARTSVTDAAGSLAGCGKRKSGAENPRANIMKTLRKASLAPFTDLE